MKLSPLDQGIDYIAYKVKLYSVIFGVGFAVVGVGALLVAAWIKLNGNDWSREYLGMGISFIVTALLQYFPWTLAGNFYSRAKKISSLFIWLLINLFGIALHIVTRG